MSKNDQLYDACRTQDVQEVSNLLKTLDCEIDIFYEDGSFFQFALSHNNLELSRALFLYFKQKEQSLQNDKQKLFKYRTLLDNVLIEAFDTYEVSTEIKNLFIEYSENCNDDIDSTIRYISQSEVDCAIKNSGAIDSPDLFSSPQLENAINQESDVFISDTNSDIKTLTSEADLLDLQNALAFEFLKEGKLEDAEKILQLIVTSNNDNEKCKIDTHFYLGIINYNQNKYMKATSYLKKVVDNYLLNTEGDQMLHEALFYIGHSFFSLKKYKAAIKNLDLIPDDYQNSLSTHIFKYLSHMSLSTIDYEEATNSLQKAIMLDSTHKNANDNSILSIALQNLNGALPLTCENKICFDKNVDKEIIEYAINFKLVQSLLYTTIHQHYGDKSADHMQASVEKLTAFYCDNPSKIEEGMGQLSSIMQGKSQTITKILNDFLEKLSLDSNQHFSHSFSTPETNYTDAVSAHTHEQRSGSGDSSEVETLGATTQLHNDDIDIVY